MLRQVDGCRATGYTLPSEPQGLEIKITEMRDLDLEGSCINVAT
ncbi:hypothetical protein [Nitrobacter sp. 62-23]|nr:hypothetical protein [Nitrobacter sp. 62-23]